LNIIRKMYEPFEQQNVPLLVMDPISAELTKYAANCMLATRISFMNDLADLCEKIGGDIEYIRQGIGTDQRIGPDFLQAGLGYGGSCFPKDIQALIHVAQAHDHQLRVIPAAAQVNDYQQHSLFHKINNYFTGQLKDKKIAIWGLAFKPGTDDMRSSPAILLINRLLSAGAQVSVSDPQAINAARAIFSDKITYYPDHLDTIDNVDSLIIVTNWPQYQTPDFAFLKSQMRSPVIFDGRNLYSPDQMKNLGFEYFSVGRKAPFLL
ncbi:MAG: nucleotide sugar dehydrogenase, partial [Patescibacteria group bacterium]